MANPIIMTHNESLIFELQETNARNVAAFEAIKKENERLLAQLAKHNLHVHEGEIETLVDKQRREVKKLHAILIECPFVDLYALKAMTPDDLAELHKVKNKIDDLYPIPF